jgi:hypothetical protein
VGLNRFAVFQIPALSFNQQPGQIVDRRTFLKTASIGIAALTIPRLSRAPQAAPELQDNGFCRIVVFGADGLRFDHSKELIDRGAPALGSLHPPICSLSGGFSVTQPGWASIWSGLPSYCVGSYTNGIYGAMPAGMHIMEKLMDVFSDEDFFPLWITGKENNIKGNIPESPHYAVYRRIVEEGHPGIYHGDEKREDREVYDLAVDALGDATSHDHFCCFVHFKNPDGVGHGQRNYEIYMNYAFKVDEYIWDLMQILPPETDVIYCSDHGFDFMELGDPKTNHFHSPQGMLATSFRTRQCLSVSQNSIGRLIYRRAGQNPDYTFRGENSPYKMYGIDLV